MPEASASPTEFLTLTVWTEAAAAQAFAQSGAHRRFLWLVTRWSAAFWSLRWEPTLDEWGTWRGRSLATRAASRRPVSPVVAAGLARPDPPPRSSLAVEPRGAPVVGVLARAEGPRALPLATTTRRTLARISRSEGGLLRWAVGLDLPPQVLVVSLWVDRPETRQAALALLGPQLGYSWAMCWTPGEYEVGHWAGLRLRQAARRPVAGLPGSLTFPLGEGLD